MSKEQNLTYYEDQYADRVRTRVLGVSGGRLLLASAIAIPASNTEPGDKAYINGEVIKSLERDKERNLVWYQMGGSYKPGDEVELRIDWEWRLNFMKLHSILHLVAGVYDKICRGKNNPVAGVVKEAYCELVFKETVPQDFVQEVVELANKDVRNGLEVKHRWDETREGFRWTQIGDYSPIPDGGLHVRNTKEIEQVYYLGSTTKDGKTKLRFSYFQNKDEVLAAPKVNAKKDRTTIKHNIGIQEIDFAKDFETELLHTKQNGNFDDLYLKYLSKTHGLLTQEIKKLASLPSEEKKVLGPKLNELKKQIEDGITKARTDYQLNRIGDADIDLTIPYPPVRTGYLHPATQVIRQMNDFFRYYGFSVMEGPEIETVEYNFRRLNLPEGHPATDLQDTLFINEPNILLRGHTSSVEARILEEYQPPIRVVIPGKCYRNETANPTNTPFFHQYQGFVVDKGITIQNLKWMMEVFHRHLFGDDVELRFRYKYYPEVSPGMGVDVKCRFCNGLGCPVCKQRGWMEVLGCGMIHYNTLEMSGIDPEIYTGFAWGMGLDRLVMAKFGISDIRKLYGGLAYI